MWMQPSRTRPANSFLFFMIRISTLRFNISILVLLHAYRLCAMDDATGIVGIHGKPVHGLCVQPREPEFVALQHLMAGIAFVGRNAIAHHIALGTPCRLPCERGLAAVLGIALSPEPTGYGGNP